MRIPPRTISSLILLNSSCKHSVNGFCRHIWNVFSEHGFTSPIHSYTFPTEEYWAPAVRSSTTAQWVYREAVKTMSRRMAREAFSILLPRTESPTMRVACRTSFSTSSRRCMLRTTVPSWTSVSWAISAKGSGEKEQERRSMNQMDLVGKATLM